MESEYLAARTTRNANGIREIVDESDVYVDVHKAIRRLNPAPRARRIEAAAAAAAVKKTTEHPVLVDIAEDQSGNTIQVGSYGAHSDNGGASTIEQRPRTAIFMRRRSSAGPDGRMDSQPEPYRGSLMDVKQQLKLGPANRAARPRNTKDVFKTKAGLGAGGSAGNSSGGGDRMPPRSVSMAGDVRGSERTPLLDRRLSDDDRFDRSNGDEQ